MELMLIEKHVRVSVPITRTSVTPTGKIRIEYANGTVETHEDSNKEKKNAEA
jgi:hypothetical protein